MECDVVTVVESDRAVTAALLPGDISFSCCLDTGADVSVLSSSVLARIIEVGGRVRRLEKRSVVSIYFGSAEFPTTVDSQVVMDVVIVTDIGRVCLSNVEFCIVSVDMKFLLG